MALIAEWVLARGSAVRGHLGVAEEVAPGHERKRKYVARILTCRGKGT